MSTIYIRRAQQADLDDGWAIIEGGRKLLRASGSPQWSNNKYPTRQILQADIGNGLAWLLICDNQPAAIATLGCWPEPDYLQIIGGHWLFPGQPYTVIHRIAVSNHFRGHHLAVELIRQLLTISRLQGYQSCRVDTYKDNLAMQRALSTCGFTHCGTIYTTHNLKERTPETARLAYEVDLRN